jgi:hypothetical protein
MVIPSSTGIFSVKSAYQGVQNRSALVELDDSTVSAFRILWKTNVPLKITIFGWRLLLEKLPTREALFAKSIITNNHDRNCVFCFNSEESIHHIFFDCYASATVWKQVFKWMGLDLIRTDTIQQNFIMFGELLKGKINKRFRHII